MRFIAHAVLMISCSLAIETGVYSAEDHTTWRVLGQAKIQLESNSKATIPFRPELSLDENNRALAKFRSSTAHASVVVPSSVVQGPSVNVRNLVNRTVRLSVDDRIYSGRVTAVMLGPDGTATIFAQIENGDRSEVFRLVDGQAGLLSIEG